MPIDKLKRIIAEFDKSSSEELTYDDGDLRIKLRKKIQMQSDEDEESITPDTTDWIMSPVPGIFLDASPAVRVGEKVAKGQIVCQINAMKVINKIAASRDGIIEEIAYRNGDTVDANAPLIRMSSL